MRNRNDFLGMLIFVCLFLFEPFCFAAFFGSDEPAPHQELTLKEKSRSRLYPGGKDEEPLRVQPQVLAPSRKHSNSIENSTEPNSED
jgi:hypothetical protein